MMLLMLMLMLMVMVMLMMVLMTMMLMMMVMISISNSASYNWGGDHLRRAGASVEWRAQWPLLRSNIDHTTNYTRIHRRLKYILLL